MIEPISEESRNSDNNRPQRSTTISISPPTETPSDPQDPETSPDANLGNLNLGARTMERSRLLVNNISTRIEEIQPYIEQRTGISLSFWRNLQRVNDRTSPTQEPNSEEFYVINMEEAGEFEPINPPPNTSTDNYVNNIREAANAESQNNNNDAEDLHSSMNPEARKFLKLLQRYIPFLMILLFKCVYDYTFQISHFLIFFATTILADMDLKREISKQQNRSQMALLKIIFYITFCVLIFCLMFDQPHLIPFSKPTTAWELLWSVAITDFMLKLGIIVVKVLLTLLSAKIIPLQSRGKYYLMLEAISQLIRSFAPIQPWLYFLFEAYQGLDKFFGISLICIYVISKVGDVLSRARLFKHAVNKMMQHANVGTFPTKSELAESGGICTICHDEFSTPVRLHCSHVFCELCVITWLDRKCSCPLCRTLVTDNPIYRNGHTDHFIQLF